MGNGGGRASPERDGSGCGGSRLKKPDHDGAEAGGFLRGAAGPHRSQGPIVEALLSLVGEDRLGAATPAWVEPGTLGDPVDLLLRAVLDADPTQRKLLLHRLAVGGADTAALIDRLIPAAARRLGELWSSDRMGFAEVSLASVGLQGLVRELTPPPQGACDAPLVAVVVRPGETHTLGAAVAAARLRRAGASVMLLMGRSDEEVAEAVRGGDLRSVCLSASNRDDLPALARLVRRIRGTTRATILLGGSILLDAESAALRGATGVDRVCAEPEEALRPCGGAPARWRET